MTIIPGLDVGDAPPVYDCLHPLNHTSQPLWDYNNSVPSRSCGYLSTPATQLAVSLYLRNLFPELTLYTLWF